MQNWFSFLRIKLVVECDENDPINQHIACKIKKKLKAINKTERTSLHLFRYVSDTNIFYFFKEIRETENLTKMNGVIKIYMNWLKNRVLSNNYVSFVEGWPAVISKDLDFVKHISR